ncbi:hypothetical protein ACHAXS_008311 [Conticribra weissflogii]
MQIKPPSTPTSNPKSPPYQPTSKLQLSRHNPPRRSPEICTKHTAEKRGLIPADLSSSQTRPQPQRLAAILGKKITSTEKGRAFFVFLFTLAFAHHKISSLQLNSIGNVDDSKSLATGSAIGWLRPKVIYGHVHMAKTAGTEINALLAMKYERVCGHKGYSYDFHQVNERHKQYSENHNNVKSILGRTNDLISKSGVGGRDQIPMAIMKEVGFEDCDFISIEEPASTWSKLDLKLGGWPIEFHVPCRDPLSHLMSQCNFHNKKFRCDSSDMSYIHSQVQKCIDDFHNLRYREDLRKFPNATMKCFDPIPPSNYVDYMGNILQHRRIKGD